MDLNRKNLTFLATFDKSLNADYGLGEIKQFRAEDVSRKKVEPEKVKAEKSFIDRKVGTFKAYEVLSFYWGL